MDVDIKKMGDPFPGMVNPTSDGGILVTKLDDAINWAR
jgi:hypothetical protein